MALALKWHRETETSDPHFTAVGGNTEAQSIEEMDADLPSA